MGLKDSGVLPDAEDVDTFSKDPDSLPLWKRILLKNDSETINGENNEDN